MSLGAFGPAFMNTLNTVNSGLTTINSGVQTVSNTIQTIKGGGTSQPANSNLFAQNPSGANGSYSNAPSQSAKSNTQTYLLIGGGVVVAGTLIYFATRKKGKK